MTEAELTARLERLERDNRRLKRGALALFVTLVALTTIYATRPVPEVIKAHEFEAVDGLGKVRVDMGISPPEVCGTPLPLHAPGLVLYDSAGTTVAELRTNHDFGTTTSDLMIRDPKNADEVEMLDSFGNPSFYLGTPPPAGTAISMGIGQGTPNIKLRDALGFIMELGGTQTLTERTGQTQNTSADSIIMFGNGKKHHVIWQAP